MERDVPLHHLEADRVVRPPGGFHRSVVPRQRARQRAPAHAAAHDAHVGLDHRVRADRRLLRARARHGFIRYSLFLSRNCNYNFN